MSEFIFEQRPWEEELLSVIDSISAARLLTLLEGETEESAEDAMDMLAQKQVSIDLDTLPKVPVSGDLAVRLRAEEQMVKTNDFTMNKNDPLRLYLDELAQIPHGNIDAADKEKLTDLLLPETAKIAMEYTGRGVLLLDLIQEANLGLWQGVQSYIDGDVRTH